MTRRHPEFEPGSADAEAAQLEQVERCRQVQIQWLSDAVKNQFFNVFQYVLQIMSIESISNTLLFIKERRVESALRTGGSRIRALVCQSSLYYLTCCELRSSVGKNQLLGRIVHLNGLYLFVPSFCLISLMNGKDLSQEFDQLSTTLKSPILEKLAKIHRSIDSFYQKKFWLRRVLFLIYDYTPLICRIILIASSIKQIRSGNKVTGGITFGAHTLDILCQKGWLPFAFRSRFYSLQNLSIPFVGVLHTQSWVFKIENAFEVSSILYQLFSKEPSYKPIIGQDVKTAIDIKQVKINPDHIQPPALLAEPSIDLGQAIQKLQPVLNDPKAKEQIKRFLANDDVYQEKLERQQSSPPAQSTHFIHKKLDLLVEVIRKILKIIKKILKIGSETDPLQPDEYIRKGLKLFVERIMTQSNTEGEAKSQVYHDQLRIMAKHIVVNAQEQTKVFQQDTLIRLGACGYYCETGYFRVVEEGYRYLAEINKLKDQILKCLHNARDRLFQKIPPKLDDIHSINAYKRILGSSTFGISSIGADSENLTVFEDFFLSVCFKMSGTYKLIQNQFNRDYNPLFVMNNVKDAIKNREISYFEISQWFKVWYMRNNEKDTGIVADKNAEQFFQRLVYDVDEEKVVDEYLIAMLVELGVFHPKEQKNTQL